MDFREFALRLIGKEDYTMFPIIRPDVHGPDRPPTIKITNIHWTETMTVPFISLNSESSYVCCGANWTKSIDPDSFSSVPPDLSSIFVILGTWTSRAGSRGGRSASPK